MLEFDLEYGKETRIGLHSLHNRVIKGIKMGHSTLIKSKDSCQKFHEVNQAFTTKEKPTKIKKARPLIYIKRPTAS
jgi:hypothetical protein